jgi:hypothetical protein
VDAAPCSHRKFHLAEWRVSERKHPRSRCVERSVPVLAASDPRGGDREPGIARIPTPTVHGAQFTKEVADARDRLLDE